MGPKKKPPEKNATKPAVDKKAATKKKLTAEQKKALFVNYDTATRVYDKIATSLVKASEEKSAAVQAINDALGTGPFKWKGTQLNIVCRKGSDDKPSVYYFKSPTRADIQEIG